MSMPLSAEIARAAEASTVVARYSIEVNQDGSGDYKLGTTAGLAGTERLRSGFEDGDRIHVDRCVVVAMQMPSSSRLPPQELRSSLKDGLQLHYNAKLAMPNLLLTPDDIMARITELAEADEYRRPGATWSLSVLGNQAFCAAQRGLYLTSGAMPVELEPPNIASLPSRGYARERIDALYTISRVCLRRMYESPVNHEEAILANGVG